MHVRLVGSAAFLLLLLTATAAGAVTAGSAPRAAGVKWKGTIDGNGKDVGTAQTCTGTWRGTVEFTVTGSTVSGSGQVDLGSPSCTVKLPTPDIKRITFTLTGTKDSTPTGETRFRLFLHPKSISPSVAPIYDPSSFEAHFGQKGEGILLVLTGTGNRIDQRITKTVRYSGATVTLRDHFVLGNGCDPDLLAKALREYDTATDFTKAGVKELDQAASDLRDFRNDYLKESAEIGGEKFSILKGLEALSHTAVEAVEVTAFYVGIGVTIEELYTKIVPAIRESGKLSREADADFKRAEEWAARGDADLKQALAQAPCAGPLEDKLNKLLDDQRVEDQARKVIDSWENNGYLYVNPITGEVLDEGAALKAARAAVLSRKTQGAGAPPRHVKADAAQLHAALRAITRASTSHGKAQGQVARLQAATDTARARLRR